MMTLMITMLLVGSYRSDAFKTGFTSLVCVSLLVPLRAQGLQLFCIMVVLQYSCTSSVDFHECFKVGKVSTKKGILCFCGHVRARSVGPYPPSLVRTHESISALLCIHFKILLLPSSSGYGESIFSILFTIFLLAYISEFCTSLLPLVVTASHIKEHWPFVDIDLLSSWFDPQLSR